jgi:hypothetical protein
VTEVRCQARPVGSSTKAAMSKVMTPNVRVTAEVRSGGDNRCQCRQRGALRSMLHGRIALVCRLDEDDPNGRAEIELDESVPISCKWMSACVASCLLRDGIIASGLTLLHADVNVLGQLTLIYPL